MIMHGLKHNTMAEEELFLLPGYQDQLRSTLSNSIYDNLPEPLRDLFTTIDNPYERDILLLGTLTVLSGCMPNVIGFYDRKWVSPNLYTFIEAPAGSGKGVLSWTRLVGMEIHKMLLEETTLAKKQFEELKREKIKQKDADVSALKEPPYKLLFIPANNSASSVVQTLSENDGAGILFSTEADTLANALAQDWGNFSDVLRAAFHHEPVEMQRRQNREHFSVERPRLSVLLTGTRGQVIRLIPDTENGLFSRFMFYSFPAVPTFRNVFDHRGTDPGHTFRKVGQMVKEMYLFLQGQTQALELYLLKEHQDRFIKQFQLLTHVAHKDSGTPILATIHRLGLICFRMSMVFTTMRYYSQTKRDKKSEIKIQSSDLEISGEIAYTLLYHANMLVADMKNGSKYIQQQAKQQRFFDILPVEFNWTLAVGLGQKLNMSPSSVRRYLLGGEFERIGKGQYRKVIKGVAGEH
jgi:hypothetical protein